VSARNRRDAREAVRRFRRRTATVVAVWSMAVTLVALVVVGVAVFGGEGPGLDAGLGSAGGGGGPLRGTIGAELGPMLAEPLSGIRAAYRDRAVAWGALALVVVGATSGAAGWWYGGRLLDHATAGARPRGRGGSS